MMRGSAIAISVGDRLVRDVEHRDAVPAYAARTAVAPVGIDDVVRIPEGLNEGTLAALLGRRHRGIRKSGGLPAATDKERGRGKPRAYTT